MGSSVFISREPGHLDLSAHIQLIFPMFLVWFEQLKDWMSRNLGFLPFLSRLILSISFLFIKSSLGNRFVSLHYNKLYLSMPCFSFPNSKMTCIYSCLWPFALVSMLLVAMCSFSGMNMSHHHIDSHMLLLVSGFRRECLLLNWMLLSLLCRLLWSFGPKWKLYDYFRHLWLDRWRLFGKSNHPKFISVSSRGQAWLADWVDMAAEWSHLVNEWCLCHRTRKLLKLQDWYTTLLQERSWNTWSHAWCFLR